MRQLWERIKCAFLLGPRSRGSLTGPAATVRGPTLVGLSGVAVVVAALALAGASGARSGPGPGPVSARPLSGAPALKQAKASGIDIGAVIATVRQHVDPVPGTPAPEDQLKPSIAFDGTNYLVVWQDGRFYSSNGYEIYGAPYLRGGYTGAVDGQGAGLFGVSRSDAGGGPHRPILGLDLRARGRVLLLPLRWPIGRGDTPGQRSRRLRLRTDRPRHPHPRRESACWAHVQLMRGAGEIELLGHRTNARGPRLSRSAITTNQLALHELHRNPFGKTDFAASRPSLRRSLAGTCPACSRIMRVDAASRRDSSLRPAAHLAINQRPTCSWTIPVACPTSIRWPSGSRT